MSKLSEKCEGCKCKTVEEDGNEMCEDTKGDKQCWVNEEMVTEQINYDAQQSGD